MNSPKILDGSNSSKSSNSSLAEQDRTHGASALVTMARCDIDLLRSQLAAQSAVVEAAKSFRSSGGTQGWFPLKRALDALASAGSEPKWAGGGSEAAKCRSCDGEGWVIPRSQFDDGVRCRDCRGTGIAPATEEPAPKQGEAPVWERHHYSILRDREQLAICETRDQAEAVVETVKADLRNAPAGVPVERVEAAANRLGEQAHEAIRVGRSSEAAALVGASQMVRALLAKPGAGGGG